MSAGETIIYQDKSVTITTARAILGGTTYAMANITSVRQTLEPANVGCLVLFTFLAVAVAIGSLLNSSYGLAFFVGLLGAGLGYATWKARRPKHWVSIGTAGAEQRAIYSLDEAWTRTVVSALNDAIIARG